jgi:hypothetical protein
MGEHLLKILLSELATARIVYARCKAAVEATLDTIAVMDDGKCPGRVTPSSRPCGAICRAG